jgi:hypothetical protein
MLDKYVLGDIKYIFTKFYRHFSTNNEANRKIISPFNLLLFPIFPIVSLFNLLFFHIFPLRTFTFLFYVVLFLGLY